MGEHSFVVVANRLPVDAITHRDGHTTWAPSPGGLVSALSPVLARHQGCWVGWPGTVDTELAPFSTEDGYLLHPVTLSADDFERFYEGFSNATLWPLYHDLIVPPVYSQDWWECYREVNLKFAEAVADVSADGATVWVQDYQLQLVPGILRQLRPDLKIGFFLHIPFPAADLFRQLPWRAEVVRGMLGADLIGFHLEQSAKNFLDLLSQVEDCAAQIQGAARDAAQARLVSTNDGRQVRIGAYPISLDTEPLLSAVQGAETAQVREQFARPQTLLLGVDRLDYTKGILHRLRAFEELLESGAVSAEDTVFVQIATPSRERIEQYQQTRLEVEAAVSRINGRFGSIGHTVVQYLHQSVSKDELAGLYAAADVMVVTPLKDGMNLVAKEYVTCHPDGSGALVLSEFAGAAVELSQAYLCNPYNVESVKRQLLAAIQAVAASDEAAQTRMLTMHDQVISHDVHRWARSFLEDLV